MAPALSVTPREPHTFDTAEDIEPSPQRRRALASVDNIATHMEEDDMGLQNQPSLAKDSQEMEQILVDLGSSDLAQADLLQVIKTFETGGDGLSTGDADAIFPLSGFDLPDAADSESDAAEDKIRLLQARLERRCAFLQRRLRILQARNIGKRVSEEAAQSFEKCIRGARKDGVGRPVGLKAFLKRIETTATLQASAASRTVMGPKYYSTGSNKLDPSKSASVGVPSGTLTGLEDTAGALRSHLSVVKHELDSDATASSSGAESNDEAVAYNNPHQQHMPIEKRALWSWQRARSSIASRWYWLQAHVQELEYKIRQYNELHKQVRESKGPVELEGSPAAYEGELPGAADAAGADTCARVRPLRRETFKKRKVLVMNGLHMAVGKAAKPSDIRCSCVYKAESCCVCTGRAEPTEPAPPACTLPPPALRARLDPAYHPVLGDIKDLSPSTHLSLQVPAAWFRARAAGAAGAGGEGVAARPRGAAHASLPRLHPHHAPRDPLAPNKLCKKHPMRLKRGRPPLSRKIRERDRDDESSTSNHERARGRPSTESRARRQSYDIDNIVIPQSVAANTRPEILTYKEIITPKWRVLDVPSVSMNNGVSKSDPMSIEESEEEDVSEAAVSARHVRAEQRERSRYARKPRRRRADPDPDPDLDLDLDLDPDPAPAPAPAPDHDAPPPPPPDPPNFTELQELVEYETVRPYSPRQFPLGERAYAAMVSDMPAGHRAGSPAAAPPDDDCSSLSPLSAGAFDGDDPDDAEWDPSIEKTDRRKNSFR